MTAPATPQVATTRATRSGLSLLLDFARINQAALASLGSLLRQLLPGERIKGREYLALNPRRSDEHVGSFKVNLRSANGPTLHAVQAVAIQSRSSLTMMIHPGPKQLSALRRR